MRQKWKQKRKLRRYCSRFCHSTLTPSRACVCPNNFSIISAFFLRVERPAQNPPTPSGQPKPLAIAPQQNFDPAAYYVWFIASSPLSTYIGSAAMVAVILAGVMFPLWPPIMRQGVSYLSMGVLGLIGLFIGVAVVRLILWMLTSLVLRKGIWWFPNLFEDVGFVSLAFTQQRRLLQDTDICLRYRSIPSFHSGDGTSPHNRPAVANQSLDPAKRSDPARPKSLPLPPRLVQPLRPLQQRLPQRSLAHRLRHLVKKTLPQKASATHLLRLQRFNPRLLQWRREAT